MLVKTISRKYGRINRKERSGLRVKVLMLNENLHPLRGKGEKVYEFYKPYEIIYNPEITIKL